jgi:hypothetical protein
VRARVLIVAAIAALLLFANAHRKPQPKPVVLAGPLSEPDAVAWRDAYTDWLANVPRPDRRR